MSKKTLTLILEDYLYCGILIIFFLCVKQLLGILLLFVVLCFFFFFKLFRWEIVVLEAGKEGITIDVLYLTMH